MQERDAFVLGYGILGIQISQGRQSKLILVEFGIANVASRGDTVGIHSGQFGELDVMVHAVVVVV